MNSSTSISKCWLAAYGVALISAVGLGWLYAARFEPETRFWVAAFEERRDEVKKRSDEPHVIFTGDSACSFGIDPAAFTEVTGIPSYNLGGTRQMGMEIFMKEALTHARKGDVIVLICSPQLLAVEDRKGLLSKSGSQMELALSNELSPAEFVSATRPGFNHLMSLGAKVALGKPLLRYQPGDRQPGGQVTTSKRDHPPGRAEFFTMEGEVSAAESELRAWRDRCQEKGVKLCYLLPLEYTDASILEENRRRKQEFLADLVESNTGIAILDTPGSACRDDGALFADTLFHLTETAAADFTRQVAPVVMEALKK